MLQSVSQEVHAEQSRHNPAVQFLHEGNLSWIRFGDGARVVAANDNAFLAGGNVLDFHHAHLLHAVAG